MRERGFAAGLLVVAALGALLLFRYGVPTFSEDPAASASAATRRKAPSPAGAPELALVAPLELGAELEGWEVRYIGSIMDGRLPMALAHEGKNLGLEVMLAGDDGPEPAAATRRFHVFYRTSGADPEDGARLAHALAKVLAKNGRVAPPPGMTTYRDPGRDPWMDGI